MTIKSIVRRFLPALLSNRSLLIGVAANIVGKVWVVLLQLATLAVLPSHWGLSQYGQWLILTSIPTYIAIGGLGFASAASTDMTSNVARGLHQEALRNFQSVWLLVTLMTGAIFCVGLLAWVTVDQITPIVVTSFHADAPLATVILALYSLATIQSNLIQAGYRSTGAYALGTFVTDVITLLEGLGVIVVVVLADGGFVAAAATMLLVRMAGHFWLCRLIFRRAPWFRIGIRHADWATIRRLAKPAMGSLGMITATALSLQGIITTIGMFISPAAAATFGPIRTLCRLPLQVSDLVGRASLPELTSAFTLGNRTRFNRLTAMNIMTSVTIAVPFFIILSVYGREITSHITRGAIDFTDNRLFILLAGVTLIQAIWTAMGQSLQSVNRHHRFSIPYMGIAALTAFAPVLVSDTSAPLVNVAFMSLLAEFLVLVFVSVETYLLISNPTKQKK